MKQTQRGNDPLLNRRRATEQRWGEFVSGERQEFQLISPEINSSWLRSNQLLKQPQSIVAPTKDEYEIRHTWQESPLRSAAKQEREQMQQLAKEGSLVVALADASGELLWTYASNHMRKRAEEVNFIAGGQWSEANMGTNAVGLATRLKQPCTVFSSEHYLPSVHEWVCYAAPIIHPQTQELVGVIDLSSTWKKHTPLGQMAVMQLAQSIANRLPNHLPRAELEIYALGQQRVTYMGKSLHVSHRQLEMLCLLALNPQGLKLDAFHAALYGDAPVSMSTLKAELSHLRRMLDGKIGSRPYRLLSSVWTDFINIWGLLKSNNATEALALYRGVFLPQSNSPELESWRHCIEAVMGQMVDNCTDVSLLMNKMCSTSGHSIVRERFAELLENKPSLG